MNRMNPSALIAAHWKGLQSRAYPSNGGEPTTTPDGLARLISAGAPVTVGGVAVIFIWQGNLHLAEGTASLVVTAATLAVGGMLAAFAQLASWRSRLAERDLDIQRPLRALIDEAVVHILLAVLESASLMLLTVLSLLLPNPWAIVPNALVVAVGSHLVLLFFIIVPRLYSAYVQVNEVTDEVNGYARRR